MATTARVFRFDVAIDRAGTARSGKGGGVLEKDDAWWAEHLVLAALVRCTLASLAHAARRADLEVVAEGSAHGTVSRRAKDGRYAFVEIEARFELSVAPTPTRTVLRELLERAERGCFVGNSLTARPRYRWVVDGAEVES